MKLGRTVAFVVLFLAAMSVYVFQVRLEKRSQATIPDEVNRKVRFERSEGMDRIEILDRVRKTRVILRKENGAWRLESPVRYAADSGIVEGLAMVAPWASQQPRLQAEKEWEEYGLASPELEVTFEVSRPGTRTSFDETVHQKTEKLYVGSKAPIGNALYARWLSERGYILVSEDVRSVFRQSVYSFREKRLFRLSADDCTKIYVEMGKHICQWKKEKGQWYWMEPVAKLGKKVSSEKIMRVLIALRGLYIKEFLDQEKRSKAELGFFMIHDRIRIDAGPAKHEEFHFGNEVPQKSAFYGLRENDDEVILLDRGKAIELLDLIQAMEKAKD